MISAAALLALRRANLLVDWQRYIDRFGMTEPDPMKQRAPARYWLRRARYHRQRRNRARGR